MPAVARADRVDPRALVRREIGAREGPARGRGEARDALGEPAAVERLAPGRGELAERAGEVGHRPDVARLGRASVTGEGVAPGPEARVADLARRVLGGRRLPALRGDRRDRKALRGVLDGGDEDVFEVEPAELLVHGRPRRGRARYRHRQPAARRDVIQSGLREERAVVGRERAPRSVEAVHALAVPHQGDRVATDAVARGLDDRQGGRRRDRGVDGVAASLERPQPGLRGERLAGGHDAARGEDGHSPGPVGVAIQSVHCAFLRPHGLASSRPGPSLGVRARSTRRRWRTLGRRLAGLAVHFQTNSAAPSFEWGAFRDQPLIVVVSMVLPIVVSANFTNPVMVQRACAKPSVS